MIFFLCYYNIYHDDDYVKMIIFWCYYNIYHDDDDDDDDDDVNDNVYNNVMMMMIWKRWFNDYDDYLMIKWFWC